MKVYRTKGGYFYKELKNGKIIIIQNSNDGWSYGAFNKGFEVLKLAQLNFYISFSAKCS